MDIEGLIVNVAVSLLALAPVVYVVVGLYYWKIKPPRTTSYFSLLMFAAALYSFGYFLEINATNAGIAFFLRNFEYLGTVFVPAFFLLFILQTSKLFPLTKRITAALCSVSTALWLLYAADPYLHLFYKSIVFTVGKYGGVMITEKYIGFYSLLAYYIAALLYSSILLFKAVNRAPARNSKKRLKFLFYTFQVSWLAVIFILAGLDTYVDPTPLTIMVMCGMFSANAIYNDMFERNVIRWTKNYNTIKNPAFLVDYEGTLVCSNEPAQKLMSGLSKNFDEIKSVFDEGEKNRKPVLLAAEGKSVWIDIKKSTLNTKGTLTNYLLIDVTDEKNKSFMAELFFNAIDDFVFITTPAGEILFVNSEVKHKLGYLDEDIRVMHIIDLHPEESRKKAQAIFAEMMKDNKVICRLPLQAKSGDLIPVETRIWTGNWNGESVIFTMSKDVSLYEEAEEKFEKSFYKNPAVMAITDADTGEYLEVNDAFVRKLGYSRQEIIKKTPSELSVFVDKNRQFMAKELLIHDGEFSDFEADVRAKDGSLIKGLFSGNYFTTRNSINLLTVMIDITENYKKDSLLVTITAITQDFLKEPDYKEAIPKAFALLGEALDVSRVVLFSAEEGGLGSGKILKPFAEWCSPGIANSIDSLDMKELFNDNNIAYYDPLLKKQPLVTVVREMDDSPVKSIYIRWGIKSVLRLPIFDNDVFWGFLSLHDCRLERLWTQIEKNAMEVFIDSLTMAIQRHNRTERIEYLSFHDYLTGLYNRRYYEQAVKLFDNESHYPLTLVMADVNGLKLTNDAFGHSAGDLLLQRIAAILKRECRAKDIVARIGGDEFVILLPKTDVRHAAIVTDRINKAIANERVDHLFLSISVGFAVKEDNSCSMNDVFRQAEDVMYRNKLSESSSVRSKTIDLIFNSLFEKNNREMMHSERVGRFCEDIAKAMDLPQDEINQMRIAGFMHDIGKIGVSESVLNKPDKLLLNESAEIKRHSEIGYRILGSVNEFSKIADCVLEHHERLDGTGYPKGLKEDEISQQARIIAIADAFDAMTADRPYRASRSTREAVEEIKRCCGSQFDSGIARIFVEKVLGEQW